MKLKKRNDLIINTSNHFKPGKVLQASKSNTKAAASCYYGNNKDKKTVIAGIDVSMRKSQSLQRHQEQAMKTIHNHQQFIAANNRSHSSISSHNAIQLKAFAEIEALIYKHNVKANL